VHELFRHCSRLLALAIGSSLYLSSCGTADVIWSSRKSSPGGLWIASAQTIENSGLGTGGIVTSVYLERPHQSNRKIDIVDLVHDYSTQNKSIDLELKWTSPTSLEITFDNNPTITFQAVRCGDVRISLRSRSEAQGAAHK